MGADTFTIGMDYRAVVDYPPRMGSAVPWRPPPRGPEPARRHAKSVGIRVALVSPHDAHDHDVLRPLEHRATLTGLSAVLREAGRPGATTDRRDGAPQRLGSDLA